MRNRVFITGLAGIAAALIGAGSLMAHDNDDDNDRGRERARFPVSTELSGLQEVPSITTPASGNFRAWVDTKANTITWKLSYTALDGAPVQQAHVHVGQLSVNGGVSFFLCSNLGNGPPGTQACPEGPAEVSGVVTPTEIIGPAGQGVEAMSFAEIAGAIRAGKAYANVHSARWPGGEIRGQLH
jgi:hypothetical protein